MPRTSLYNEATNQQVIERINALTPELQAKWGKMDAAQMLAHCADALEVMAGEKELGKTPFIARLLKGVIRKAVIGDKPFSKNSPTHPQYVQTEPRDLERERKRLISVINRFVAEEESVAAAREHPAFGILTREERGWSMYKHLDHHLEQFGV